MRLYWLMPTWKVMFTLGGKVRKVLEAGKLTPCTGTCTVFSIMRSVMIVTRADCGTNFAPGTLTNRHFTEVVSVRSFNRSGSI